MKFPTWVASSFSSTSTLGDLFKDLQAKARHLNTLRKSDDANTSSNDSSGQMSDTQIVDFTSQNYAAVFESRNFVDGGDFSHR